MLIQGVEFLNEVNSDHECYYFDIMLPIVNTDDSSDTEGAKSTGPKDASYSPTSTLASSFSSSNSFSSETNEPHDNVIASNHLKFEKKNFKFSNSYPYILVNIGSGVSILLVTSEKDYKRISGEFALNNYVTLEGLIDMINRLNLLRDNCFNIQFWELKHKKNV